MIATVTELSVTQAARVLALSPDRVRQLADAGRLPCRRTPLGRLFDVADVDRLARERATAGQAAG